MKGLKNQVKQTLQFSNQAPQARLMEPLLNQPTSAFEFAFKIRVSTHCRGLQQSLTVQSKQSEQAAVGQLFSGLPLSPSVDAAIVAAPCVGAPVLPCEGVTPRHPCQQRHCKHLSPQSLLGWMVAWQRVCCLQWLVGPRCLLVAGPWGWQALGMHPCSASLPQHTARSAVHVYMHVCGLPISK